MNNTSTSQTVVYGCVDCGMETTFRVKDAALSTGGGLRCGECGYRILYKPRPKLTLEEAQVSARYIAR